MLSKAQTDLNTDRRFGMHFVVTLVGTISVRDGSGHEPPNVGDLLEAHLDAVMEEFLKIKVMDPDIELDLVDNRVKFAILVEADDPDKAISSASPLVRSAIHGAGGSTPEWPESDDRVWAVEQTTLSVQSAELVSA
jgi:hypothetical protein